MPVGKSGDSATSPRRGFARQAATPADGRDDHATGFAATGALLPLDAALSAQVRICAVPE